MPRTTLPAIALVAAASLCSLASAQSGVAAPSAPAVLLGLDAGELPEAQLIGLLLPAVQKRALRPYGTGFQGGVRVASGDVNGDGIADIVTGSGPGGGPHVKVFDGATGETLRSFFPYDAGFQGGVHIAVGDVTGDGADDIITGAGGGSGGHIKIFDGATGAELLSFLAFPGTPLGATVATVGDLDGDGHAEIVAGRTGCPCQPGGAPHVKVFSGASGAPLQSLSPFGDAYAGNVAIWGDPHINETGLKRIVVGGGPGAGPHIRVIDLARGQEVASFFAYQSNQFAGDLRVAIADCDDDGVGDIVVGVGPGPLAAGTPHVKVFDGRTYNLVDSFPQSWSFVYPPNRNSGVYVSNARIPLPPPACPGDADDNGVVNFADIVTTLSTFGSSCP
jgi:hypothetical protein